MDYIILVSSLILAFYLRQLVSSFGSIGLNELRRRAEAGHQSAERVLAARVHGLKLYLVIWFLFGLMIFFVVTSLDDILPTRWLSSGAAALLLIFLIFILPWIKAWSPKLELASQASPTLTWLLDRLQFVSRFFRPLNLSQKIYIDAEPAVHSKEHLLEIIEKLKRQTKNARVLADLDLTSLTLTFSSKKVKSLMTPLADMKRVRAQQEITPKLADELSASGFSVFPVQRSEGEDADYCGVLYVRDVKKLSRTSRPVYQLMHPQVCYVYLEAPLNQVVDAFLKTQEQLFFVVNQHRRIVGLISLLDVLEQYVGKKQLDSFQYYDDLELVAQHFGRELVSESLPDDGGDGEAARPARKALKKGKAKLKQIKAKSRARRSKRGGKR